MYILFLTLCTAALAQFATVSPNRVLVDSKGRARTFNGVNAVFKVPPFLPATSAGTVAPDSLNAADMDLLANTLGMNFIRLGVMWAGWVPVEGTTNKTYVAEVRQILDNAHAAGVAVLLDVHQDVISRATCGEGVPDWAVDKVVQKLGLDNLTSTFPAPVAAPFGTTPPPYELCEQTLFTDFYQSYASNVIFGELYSGVLRQNFLDYWEQIAAAFGSHPAVVGFEVLNEPWSGNTFADPQFVNGRYGDAHSLSPLYRSVAAVIRRHAPTMPIFFEKSWADELLPAGFDEDVWPANETGVVFSYHNYCLTSSYIPRNQIALCKEVEGLLIAEALQDAERIGVMSFLSEYGACNSSGGNLEVLQSLLTGATENWQSTAYWQFKSYHDPTTTVGDSESFFHSNMSIVDDKVAIVAHPFVVALDAPSFADATVSWSPDATSPSFSLSYQAYDLGGTVISLGYSSVIWGPAGPAIALTGDGAVYKTDGVTVNITAPAGTKVTVLISAKQGYATA